MLTIHPLHTGPLGTNTYIVYDDATRECFIVDPAEYESVRTYIDEQRLKPSHILLTHGHFDHILGVCDLKEKYGMKVCIHSDDAQALSSDKYSLAAFVGTTVKKCAPDVILRDNDVIHAAGREIRVMHTPGHSKGSVCYIIESERVIFSGDTLFCMSVGRTDLYGSSEQELRFSILYKLYALSGDYRVYPGHEEDTSLDFERTHNPVTLSYDYD